MYPKVTVIVIYFDKPEMTIRCLNSVLHLDYPEYDILVVNNGSSTESSNAIQKTFPDLKQIMLNVNEGIDPAVNAGFAAVLKSKPKYILQLPSDVVVHSQLLRELVTVAESDQEIGIVGVVNYDLKHPDVIAFTGACITNWWLGTRKSLNHRSADDLPDKPFEVDYPPVLMIRSDVIRDIGGFDTGLFIYFEEPDYCLRAKRAGYKVVMAPKAKLWHEISNKTHGKVNTYFMIRNEPRFFFRNARRLYWPTFIVRYLLKTSGKVLVATLRGFIRGNWLDLAIYGFGLRDFLLGRYGRGSIDRLIAIQARYAARRSNGE